MDKYQIGEKEYSLEDLQALIGDGEKKREYEKTYNTTFDSAWSAYGKTQNENKQLREELESLKNKTTETPKLEMPNLDEVFNQKGFVTREEAERLADERFEYKNQVNAIANQFKKLESEITGDDGRPKFVKDEVLEFMQQNNIIDAEKAYNMMHLDEIANWKAEQLTKKPGFAPTNPGQTNAQKTPAPVTYNRDNVDAALREALSERRGKV